MISEYCLQLVDDGFVPMVMSFGLEHQTREKAKKHLQFPVFYGYFGKEYGETESYTKRVDGYVLFHDGEEFISFYTSWYVEDPLLEKTWDENVIRIAHKEAKKWRDKYI